MDPVQNELMKQLIQNSKRGGVVGGLLSFLCPGLGQLCNGKILSAALWFIFVVLGYFLIIPGIILHILCIVHATK